MVRLFIVKITLTMQTTVHSQRASGRLSENVAIVALSLVKCNQLSPFL